MAGANSVQLSDRWVSIDPRIENPVLYAVDYHRISIDTSVLARIRYRRVGGEKMLRLTFKRGFSDEALQAAELLAMAYIMFNWENPRHADPPPLATSYPYVAMAGG